MNKCVNCDKNIEPKAIWCPFCGVEQNPRYNIYGTLLLFILLAAIVIYGCSCYKKYEEKKKDIEKYGQNYRFQNNNNSNTEETVYDVWYKVENEVISDTSYIAYGYVLNKENITFKNATVYFTCHNYSNGTQTQISDSKSNLRKNELWKFKVKYSGKADVCKFDKIILTK